MYTYMYMRIYVYAYICICIYMYMHICIRTYIYHKATWSLWVRTLTEFAIIESAKVSEVGGSWLGAYSL